MPDPSFFRPAPIMRGLLFGAVGLLILAVAALEVTHRLEFLQVAQAVDGQVERLNAGGSHPQVPFTTATGGSFSVSDSLKTWPAFTLILSAAK